MKARELLALSLLMAAATWTVGWWGVLVVALLFGALRDRGRSSWRAPLAAVLAWGALLCVDAAGGRLRAVGAATGSVLRVPGPVLMLVTLLFAAAAAWSAAVVGAEAAGLFSARRADDVEGARDSTAA